MHKIIADFFNPSINTQLAQRVLISHLEKTVARYDVEGGEEMGEDGFSRLSTAKAELGMARAQLISSCALHPSRGRGLL